MAIMAAAAAEAEQAEQGRRPAYPPGRWTVDMLRDLPDDGRRYELLDGALLVSPSPAPDHQLVVMNLVRLFDSALPPTHRVLVGPVDWQPDRHTSLVPDLLIVSQADYRGRYALQSLVVAAEVASPSTARIDRTAKMDRYADGGVLQYWIVDPGVSNRTNPTVIVYDLGTHGYHELVRAQADDEITVTVPVDGARPVTLSPRALRTF